MEITTLKAREILDSRGNPTIEVTISSEDHTATVSVPSGVSTGAYEAREKRDGGTRYNGMGVRVPVEAINDVIGPMLCKESCFDQARIDQEMNVLDGTPYKSKFGANAIVGVSMAVCKLAAAEEAVPLFQYISTLTKTKPVMPHPFMNIINGARHAGNNLPFQEFMIVPLKATTFAESLQMGVETYQILKDIIHRKYGKNAINVGDEGGFAPPLKDPRDALDLLMAGINQAGYDREIRIGIDSAASTIFTNDAYQLLDKNMSGDDLLEYYLELLNEFPIMSIEDPFHQDDYKQHAELLKKIPEHKQVVGDDLLVTNPERVKEAIQYDAVNALLLKTNQIGTLSEALHAFKLAQHAGWNTMVSHRSGETTDTFIADLAVGLGCGQIKAGAPCRGERIVKYNRLLQIEEAYLS